LVEDVVEAGPTEEGRLRAIDDVYQTRRLGLGA
jgi:hypothetical protein